MSRAQDGGRLSCCDVVAGGARIPAQSGMAVGVAAMFRIVHEVNEPWNLIGFHQCCLMFRAIDIAVLIALALKRASVVLDGSSSLLIKEY